MESTIFIIISILATLWIILLTKDMSIVQGCCFFAGVKVVIIVAEWFFASQVAQGTWIMDFMNMYESMDSALVFLGIVTFIVNFLAAFIVLLFIKTIKSDLIYVTIFFVATTLLASGLEQFVVPIMERIL